jgi:hypothetical protein
MFSRNVAVLDSKRPAIVGQSQFLSDQAELRVEAAKIALEIKMSKVVIGKTERRRAEQILRARRAKASVSPALGHLDVHGIYLQSAYPRLLVHVEDVGRSECETTLSISEFFGWDELIDEGYDPDGSPLGPVYWRIIRRAKERLYCSTFL